MSAVWLTSGLVIGTPTSVETVPVRTVQEALRVMAGGQIAAVEDVRLAYAVLRLGGNASHVEVLEQLAFVYAGVRVRPHV